MVYLYVLSSTKIIAIYFEFAERLEKATDW